MRGFAASGSSMRCLVLCLLIACGLAYGTAGATLSPDGGFRLLKLDGNYVKWGEGALGAGATVRYAFADSAMHFAGARNCRDLVPLTTLATRSGIDEATLRAETAAAFRAWEKAADISFEVVDDPGQADIVIGAQGQPVGRAFANVSYQAGSGDSVSAIDRALVCMNPEQKWKVGFDGDIEVYDIRYTLVHEIGHAIGLDHPGPSGQVMSFAYRENYRDLQPGDFAGVQLLYGAGRSQMTAGSGSDSRHGQ